MGLLLVFFAGCKDDDDPSPAGSIVSFVLEASLNDALNTSVTAAIDEENKNITATLPEGTDISALQPTIEVSGGSIYYPQGRQDFSSLVYYTVVASSGATTVYSVDVEVTPSSEKRIESFEFLLTENPIQINVVADIDHTQRTIFAVMPGATSLNALRPNISVSEGASISGNGVQDFNEAVTYTVVAEDGSSIDYTVEITTELDALKAIWRANRDTDLRLEWNIFDHNLENWSGVTLRNGAVVDLNIGNLGIIVIPPEIGHLRNLEDLGIQFNAFPSLPDEIGDLTNLRRLSTSLNDELTYIPPAIGRLTKLERLHIDNSVNLMSIPAEIGNLTGLESLYINGNGLTIIPAEVCALETDHGVKIYKDADMICE